MLPPCHPRLIDSAGAPPPEALQATALAAAVVRELYDSGREVRFSLLEGRGRVTARMCDADGAVISTLTPSQALGIAGGDPAAARLTPWVAARRRP